MATTDLNYRYATQVYNADGVTSDYEVAFDGGYISQDNVYAYSALVSEEGIVTDRQVHTVEFLSETNTPDGWEVAQVRISPVPEVGRVLTIFRSTLKSTSLVQYVGDSQLTKGNLDLANKQAILAIAEIMDGLAAASIDVQNSLVTTITLQELVDSVYKTVLELLASGGIISVDPKFTQWVIEDGTTDYEFPGADIDNAAMYDTYVNGLGIRPGVDYEIDMVDNDPLQTVLRLITPQAEGALLWTTLRGKAQAYQGSPPATIVDLRTPIINVMGVSYDPALEADRALLVMWSDTSSTVTVQPTPTGTPSTRLDNGSYFSVKQKGAAAVDIDAAVGVTIEYPADCLPRTRGQHSVVTLTCDDAENNVWTLTGDMARA